MAREPGAEGRASPEVRRAHLREPWHRAARHRARHDARVVRVELDGDAPRHGLRRGALSRLGDAEVRGSRRQGREADHVRPSRSRYGDALFGRGRRRRVAAARDAVAEAHGRAGPRARLHGHRGPARARARANGVHGRHGRRAPLARAEPGARARRWRRPRRPRIPPPAARSTWARRSSCKRSSTSGSSCRCYGKTQKGQPSTAEDVLEQLAEEHELPRLDPRVPRADEAEVDVHRQAADRHRSAHQAHPHVVPPGRRGDGPAVVVGPESAEHPDPHRRRPPHPPGVHRAARIQAARRRLLADRAADHGAPVRRRRLARGVRERPGRSPRDRRRGVRRGARRRDAQTSGGPRRPSTSV